IIAQDQHAICRAEGVGPKLASRIVTELKDKVAKMSFAIPVTRQMLTSESAGITEALSALINLGYKRQEALHALNEIDAT
ncbi:hypothetical protein ABTF50_21570, partial [Acinetobacter baumannii]